MQASLLIMKRIHNVVGVLLLGSFFRRLAPPTPVSTSAYRTIQGGSLMRRPLVVLLFFGGVFAAGGLAAEEREIVLLDAARTAGAEASPLVFKRGADASADTDDDTDRRISGKTILLATAIASAALVTAAWLMRSKCEPTDGIAIVFPDPPRPRHDTLPDGTLVHRASAPAPAYPLPTICAPRR